MQITIKTPEVHEPASVSEVEREEVCEADFALCFASAPTLEEIEKAYLRHLLERQNISRAEIAQTLGISERNTYRLIARHGLR